MKKIWFIIVPVVMLVSMVLGAIIYETNIFNLEIYKINVKSNIVEGKVSGSGNYKSGSKVVLKVSNSNGYYFEGLDCGNAVHGTGKYENGKITFKASEDLNCVANFSLGDREIINGKDVKVSNGKIVLNEANSRFELKHIDEKKHAGFWYEGNYPAYGFNNVTNEVISFDSIDEDVTYKFYDALDVAFIVFKDNATYMEFAENSDIKNMQELVESNKIVDVKYFKDSANEEYWNTDIEVGNVYGLGYLILDNGILKFIFQDSTTKYSTSIESVNYEIKIGDSICDRTLIFND